MRAFIQRPTDGLYMKTKTEWVREKNEARAFGSSVDALAYCVAAGLCEVRLVVTTVGGDAFLYPFGEHRDERELAGPSSRQGAAKLLRKISRPKAKSLKSVPANVRLKAQENRSRASRVT